METASEQLHYGSHCRHGVNVGTPGGFDFLCGLCETDYVYWDDTPYTRHAVYWLNLETGHVQRDPLTGGRWTPEGVDDFNRVTHMNGQANESEVWPFMLMWCEWQEPYGWTNDPSEGVYVSDY